jgi:protein phosphatase
VFSLSDSSAFGITDPGLRRSINEDAYLVDLTARCLVVADGVGGAAAGEVASEIFVSTAARLAGVEKNNFEQGALEVIRDTFLQANGAILSHASAHPESQGMACTAEMLIFFEDGFALGMSGTAGHTA